MRPDRTIPVCTKWTRLGLIFDLFHTPERILSRECGLALCLCFSARCGPARRGVSGERARRGRFLMLQNLRVRSVKPRRSVRVSVSWCAWLGFNVAETPRRSGPRALRSVCCFAAQRDSQGSRARRAICTKKAECAHSPCFGPRRKTAPASSRPP